MSSIVIVLLVLTLTSAGFAIVFYAIVKRNRHLLQEMDAQLKEKEKDLRIEIERNSNLLSRVIQNVHPETALSPAKVETQNFIS